jgi:hypothetical protein
VLICRSRTVGRLLCWRTRRCRPPVDTPTDTVKAQVPTPGPSRAEKTHGVWLTSATIIDTDYMARRVLLSNVFCGSLCLATCRSGSAEFGISSWRTRDGAARAGVSRFRDTAGRICVWQVRVGPKRRTGRFLLGGPHLVTQAVAWPTSQAIGSNLHRRPMYRWGTVTAGPET